MQYMQSQFIGDGYGNYGSFLDLLINLRSTIIAKILLNSYRNFSGSCYGLLLNRHTLGTSILLYTSCLNIVWLWDAIKYLI